MTEILETEAAANDRRRAQVRKSLARRNGAETRFKLLGLASVLAAMAFVAVLFGNILMKGVPAFWQYNLDAEVFFDPAVINVPERPVQQPGQSAADFQAEMLAWQRRLALVNWNRLITASVQGAGAGVEIDTDARRVLLVTLVARHLLRHLADADAHVDFPVVAPDLQLAFIPGAGVGNGTAQLTRRGDLLAIEREDHVALAQAGCEHQQERHELLLPGVKRRLLLVFPSRT